MTNTSFAVAPRTVFGKKVGRLRREKLLPGHVFLAGNPSATIQCNTITFEKLYEDVGETGLIYLTIEGEAKPRPVLIDEVQVDPVSGATLHVAFKQVDLSQEIEADVPVETIGEFNVFEAVMVVVKDAIGVKALPANFPEKFAVDVSTLKAVGDMITLKDLQYDKSLVEIMGVETDEDWDQPIVLVQEQKAEEPEEEPVEAEAEAEAESSTAAEAEQPSGGATSEAGEKAE